MKLYRILKLKCWCGDHFGESFRYRECGFTTDEELISRLSVIKVGPRENWPQCHMGNWPVFKFEELTLLSNNCEIDLNPHEDNT